MSKSLSLVGSLAGRYKRNGGRLIKDDGSVVLLWGKRKRDLNRKPVDFLLIRDEKKGDWRYLSSLYQVKENVYRFDDKKRFYTLIVKEEWVYVLER